MNSRQRVLLLADDFGATGGGEIIVGYLAQALSAEHGVAILTTWDGPTERAMWNGLPVYRIHAGYHPRLRPLLSIANPGVLPAVRAAIRDFRPTVAHAWNVHHYLSYESLRQVRAAGVPLALTFQDAQPFCYTKFHCWIAPDLSTSCLPDYRASPLRCRSCRAHYLMFPLRNRLVQAYLGRYVNAPISVSLALRDALHANGVPCGEVIHNGIPAGEFDPQTVRDGRLLDRLEIGEGPLIVAGGRLQYFKGHLQAVLAFQRVAESRHEARLLIMGANNWFAEQLGERARELGIENQVRLPGLLRRDEVAACLTHATAVANLSMYLDPFPTMNLEAMAAARPIVGTCFGGTPEAVEHGRTGYIVNSYDLAEAAERIGTLIDDPQLASRLGAAGRERLLNEFTIERMARDYQAVYSKLLDDR